MTTHDFRNDSDQSERLRIERDTYLTRAQSDADLTSQGRFKKETATRVTGVPTYPSLPASSPWANGFDVNVEPQLGIDVNTMEPTGTPTEIQASIEPALSPTTVASPADVGDRTGGEGPIGTTPLVPIGSFARRRDW